MRCSCLVFSVFVFADFDLVFEDMEDNYVVDVFVTMWACDAFHSLLNT